MEDLFNEKNKIHSKTIEIKDPYDPFDNPTENRAYNYNYSDIAPQTEAENCELTYKPLYDEKRRIKHFYNIAGGGIAVHFILSFVIANALNLVIAVIIMGIKNISFSEYMAGKGYDISEYMTTTSINPAINILTFLISNLLVFFIGIKISGIKFNSLFKTENLTVIKVFQYVVIGLFLQFIAGFAVSLLSNLMPGTDLIGKSDTVITVTSQRTILLSVFYSCIVAPITEELFFRGFVMKNFSRVSQRFGILMSALFFGLSHGNISQFALAFMLGIFMGYIDIKHNSIIPSILVHFTANTVATLSTLTASYASPESTEYAATSYALTGLAFIGLIAFIFFCKKNTFPKAAIAQNFRCKNIAFKSIGTVAALAIYIFYMAKTTFMLFPTLQ